jgi:hypothetical protein
MTSQIWEWAHLECKNGRMADFPQNSDLAFEGVKIFNVLLRVIASMIQLEPNVSMQCNVIGRLDDSSLRIRPSFRGV